MKKFLLLLLLCGVSSAWAASDPVVKEDFTPTAAEGPLTTEHIPSLLANVKQASPDNHAPAAENTSPTTPPGTIANT